MNLHIVGLDLSLTSTGVARIRPHAPIPVEVEVVGTAAIPPSASVYPATLARLRNLAGKIIRAARRNREEGDITIVAIEGPAYAKAGDQRGHHVRAGLWWLMFHLLEKEAIIIIVAPGTLKRYVTGKGNADKDLVLTSIVRAFPHVGVVNNNESDALGLAAMVARELGHGQEISVQRVGAIDSLDKIDWPDEILALRTITP